MEERIGDSIIDILERAGQCSLSASNSRAYSALLLHIGGTDALRPYRASDGYWKSVQAILDTFFTSAQRAEICASLVDQPGLRARAEFQTFLCHALAEQRVQELISMAATAGSAIGLPPLAPVRRGR